MKDVLSKNSIYSNDKYTIENICSEEELINKAGHALYLSYDYKGKTLVVTGKGNNGGDGLALALELKANNKDVEILSLYEYKSDILRKLIDKCKENKIKIHQYKNNFNFDEYDTIIDGIFGIGYKENVLDNYIINIIDSINVSKAYVISIDINSGLNCDNGVAKKAIKSDLTIGINSLKYGYYLNDAKDYINKLIIMDIGIMELSNDDVKLIEDSDIKEILKTRKQNVNKGTFGYVGVMGGSKQYSGSIKLSDLSLTTLVSGAGVSRIIVPSSISKYLLKDVFESTLYELPSTAKGGLKWSKKAVLGAISNLKSLGFGMGIGKSKDNAKILKFLLENYDGKLIIDADGLNTLSEIDLYILNKAKCYVILTPHIKEFSRLIKIPVEDIQNDPVYYVKQFCNKYNVVLLLKGTSTIVGYSNKTYIINTGSNALSKGGSGDILSGIITGMCGYLNTIEATIAGSYIFGKVGEECFKEFGAYSTLPTDTIKMIKKVMKQY